MTDSLKICIFGNQTTTTNLIHNLYKNKNHIDYLVTLKKGPKEIESISNIDTSLDSLAEYYGFKIYYANSYSLQSDEDLEFFKNNRFDLGLSCTWQRLIPKNILDTFKLGVFGWHGSMFRFPNGRGRSPLNWSLRLGATSIYHNLFKYDSGADTGYIFETKQIDISKKDNIRSLLVKVQDHMNESSLNLVDSIYRESLTLTPQVGESFITFPKLSENDGELFLNFMTYKQASNIVKSCTYPFPGAFISHNGNKIKVWDIKKSYFKKISAGSVLLKGKYMYLGFIDNTAKVKIK